MSRVVDICGFCPRLCRHVCPVVVATAREAATPTAIVSAVRLAAAGLIDLSVAEAALATCNGCGACTRHCALHMDVPTFVRKSRPQSTMLPLPALPNGRGRVVRVEVGEARGQAAEEGGVPVVWVEDALGFSGYKASGRPPPELARHFGGWTVRTGSFAVAEVLEAAVAARGLGIPPARVLRDVPPVGSPRFVTCWEGSTGGDGQIACCGAREGFELSQPWAAQAMAREAVARMGGREHGCADSRCTAWLREAGGRVRGPDADQPG